MLQQAKKMQVAHLKVKKYPATHLRAINEKKRDLMGFWKEWMIYIQIKFFITSETISDITLRAITFYNSKKVT